MYKEIHSLWERYDESGDDAIDKHEFDRILLELGCEVTERDMVKLWKKIDVNRDGEIDILEFISFVSKMIPTNPNASAEELVRAAVTDCIAINVMTMMKEFDCYTSGIDQLLFIVMANDLDVGTSEKELGAIWAHVLKREQLEAGDCTQDVDAVAGVLRKLYGDRKKKDRAAVKSRKSTKRTVDDMYGMKSTTRKTKKEKKADADADQIVDHAMFVRQATAKGPSAADFAKDMAALGAAGFQPSQSIHSPKAMGGSAGWGKPQRLDDVVASAPKAAKKAKSGKDDGCILM